MNSAFRNTARLATQRRLFSSSAPSGEHAFLKMRQNQPSFSKTWLSDPSTYPIVAVLGLACGMCAGVGSYYLYACKDVQIGTAKRNDVIRTWGQNPNRFGHGNK